MRLVLGAQPRLGRRRGLHVRAVGVVTRAELALSAALALVAPDLVAAHLALLHALAVAAAWLLSGSRRLSRRELAVARVVCHEEATAHALAARAVGGASALVVGLVAVGVAAADLLGGRRRGRPHRLAVLVLAHRLERAALLAVVILEHQTLALGGERLARLHPALAVRDVGVAVAAAWILRRLRRREHAVDVEDAERDEGARRAAVALIRVSDGVARVVRRAARAFAAAGRRRGGRRLGGGDHAVVLVVGEEPLAALALTARLIREPEALGLRFVARALAAARRRRGGCRRGPHHREVHVLVHRLERAARYAIRIRQLEAVALGEEADARFLVLFAVRLVRVDVAAAGLLGWFRRREQALVVHRAVHDEVAAR